MKRSLLTLLFALTLSYGFSQVIFFAQNPPSIQGNYGLTFANGGNWGVPDLNNTANSVLDTLAFAEDSLACSPLTNGASMNGNIAVVYRGSCEFGSKALEAQNNGAKACVIINNVGGGPVGMAAGADGGSVTIPVVMISKADGATLRSEYENGSDIEVFIGNKANFYNDDIGLSASRTYYAKSGMRPSLISQDNNDYTHAIGGRVLNFGSNDQTGVNLSCTIEKGGTQVYSESGTPTSIVSGDSATFSLPDFGSSLSSYGTGRYEVEYVISMGATDEFPQDDTIRTSFYFGDEYGYSTADSAGQPEGDTYLQPNDSPTFSICMHMRDANASRLAAQGMYFSATTADSMSLVGNFVEATLYEWNDQFTGTAGVAFTMLNPVASGDFTYASDDQEVNKFVNFDEAVTLIDNQRYLGCLNFFSDQLFIGFSSEKDYTFNVNNYDQPTFPIQADDGSGSQVYFLNGFGLDRAPAISIHTIDAASVGVEEETVVEELPAPYPNPAQQTLRIPMGDKQVDNARLTVHTMGGKVVMDRQVSFSNTLELDVSGLSEGRYVFKLNEDGNVNTFNVVVSK